ncbi:glycosyltransferase family 4 protein [Thalassospira marina]|uniref:Glycosyl transferase n=1 Tax=Thalassospira marina TaxID=2048283 RepID=A0ABN5FUC9_9PROT|nr:glycosyltransferase family 4 protein [Thalassospira marina]AUG55344.1 glycosyl transferase [Thalassospira marina]
MDQPKALDVTVLQIIPRLNSGGAERTTLEIAQALKQVGANAVIVSEGGRLVNEIRATGAIFIALPVASKNPFRIIGNIWKIGKIIRDHGVTLVHARSRAPAISAFFAARQAQLPFVTTYHSTYSLPRRQPFRALKNFYSSIMARGDRVIANSRFIGDLIAARHPVGAKKVRVIYRGLDRAYFNPDRFLANDIARLRADWGVDIRDRVVLFPSRISPTKGQLVVIDAVARLSTADRENLKVVFPGPELGTPDYVALLRQRVHDLGLDDIVRFVPECREMPLAYLAADVAIGGSLVRPEAFGRTAIEAQGMGCPVIANQEGGPAETVLDAAKEGGEAFTGWLIPPQDSAALASSLSSALSLTLADRQTLRLRARKHILAHFNADQMRTDTLAVYDELLGSELAVLFQQKAVHQEQN